MGNSSSSRRFVRTNVPAREQLVGGVIVLLLVGIGTGIYVKGERYDPGIYELDAAALSSTSEAVVGVAATLKGETSLAEPAAGGAGGMLSEMVDGVEAMGPEESYVADTLYEKINGRAPAYLEFNFEKLVTRSFSVPAANGQFVDVFVFRMDTPLNAFGIYSLERDASAAAVDFAADGYRSAMGYFFRQGAAYVQVIASSADPAVMDVAGAYAEALAGALPKDDSGMEARMSLPEYGRVSGSVSFTAQNAYGQEALKHVYEAKYQFEGAELVYFAMRAESEAAAEVAWQAVFDFNAEYGEMGESGEREGAVVFEAENFGDHTIVARKGALVFGVMNAGDADKARAFMGHVLKDDFPAGGPVPAEESEATNVEEEDGYE